MIEVCSCWVTFPHLSCITEHTSTMFLFTYCVHVEVTGQQMKVS